MRHIMAKNPTNFTPGPGDTDWDGIDHRHLRDLEMVAEQYPNQQLKYFRDKETGQLVDYRRGSTVFYLSSGGQIYCAACANQGDAEPSIVAGQSNGDKDTKAEVRICDGCGKQIHPIRIIRQNANARYIYHFGTGNVLCIAFETPVAAYTYVSDTVYVTDINWSKSLSKQVGRFWSSISKEPSRKAREDIAEDSYYCKREECLQESLDAILMDWTGDVRLPETRSAHENYNQGVGYRVNTRQYVGRYDHLRTVLASRATHKVAITDRA
jgi:hypothetical protein